MHLSKPLKLEAVLGTLEKQFTDSSQALKLFVNWLFINSSRVIYNQVDLKLNKSKLEIKRVRGVVVNKLY